MRLPAIQGLIDRRILVNYRIDPDVAARVLPAPFRPKIQAGYAMAGICLIRLKDIRPAFLPWNPGLGSENAAHRFAVQWEQQGERLEGVYVPRRDTSSRLNAMAGGRVFPGVHHRARFNVTETPDRLEVSVTSHDHTCHVSVEGTVTDCLPAASVFTSIGEASQFFEAGSLGYSATRDAGRFDGIELHCQNWAVQPMRVDQVASSYFSDSSVFPADSVTFDHALLMRGIDHHWRSRKTLCGESASVASLKTPRERF